MEQSKDIKSLFALYLEDKLSKVDAELMLFYLNDTKNASVIRRMIVEKLEEVESVPITISEKYAMDEIYRRLQQYLDEEEVSWQRSPGLWDKWRTWWPGKVAVVVFLFASAVLAWIFQDNINRWMDPDQLIEVHTQKGERKEVELPDGTKVHLNNQSSLIYPDRFAKDKRMVVLSGEAWFEVAKDASKPFVVGSAGIETEVLGTSFIIKAYAGDPEIRVSVFEGKVRVGHVQDDDLNDDGVVLLANEEAWFDRSSEKLSKVERVDMRDLGLWNKGIVRLRNTTFVEAIRILERIYDVDIEFDQKVSNCPVYADFSEKEPLTNVLDALAISLDGQYQQVAVGVWWISGKPCNTKEIK